MTEPRLDGHAAGADRRELPARGSGPGCSPTAVDDTDLVRQHSPLMSPLVWDLAHIANQEELWLLREVGGREPMHPEIDPLYDAFEHPRAERPTLPLLPPGEARAYAHEVRGRVLDLLGAGHVQRDPAARRRVRVRHGGPARAAARRDHADHPPAPGRGAPVLTAAPPGPPPADALRLPAEVLVPGGPFTMGTSAEPWALDNERPAHVVDVPPFYIDTTPVTYAAYAEFIADGGYDDPRWWTADGWAHRQRAGLAAPLYWRRDGGLGAPRVRGHRAGPRPPSRCCTCAGTRRTPTPAGRAAGCRPRRSGRRRPGSTRPPACPGGSRGATRTRDPAQANLGQRYLQPAPAGSYPAGAAPCGARQLIGDVWEWTSWDFLPYPGFSAWPYREYSEVFFGPEYKVLRGGSFAVGPVACRGTFRNWDYPIRRQIFAGFRTARAGVAQARRPPDVPAPGLPRAPGHAAFGDHRPAVRAVPAGVGAAPAAARHGQRGRVRGRLVRRRRPGAGQVPAGGPIWADESFADMARVTRAGAMLAAVRYATPTAPPRARPLPRRSPRAAGCSATTARSTDGPSRRPALAATLPAARCSDWRRGSTRRWRGRWCGTGSTGPGAGRRTGRTPSRPCTPRA